MFENVAQPPVNTSHGADGGDGSLLGVGLGAAFQKPHGKRLALCSNIRHTSL